MAQWIRTLAGSLCILTILLHLIPEGKFSRYVRFYAGVFFLLLAIEPVLNWIGKGADLEKYLQLEFLREEYYDMETAADGLAELKNGQIQEAYRREIRRQIEEAGRACGLETDGVDVEFGEDLYSVASIRIKARGEEAKFQEAVRETKEELAGLYLVSASEIQIVWED